MRSFLIMAELLKFEFHRTPNAEVGCFGPKELKFVYQQGYCATKQMATCPPQDYQNSVRYIEYLQHDWKQSPELSSIVALQ